MKCTAYKAINKGALLGFATIEMGSGMVIKDCSYMESNGRRWVNPPSKPSLEKDGSPRMGDNGKPLYINIVDFTTKDVRDNWSRQAGAAIDKFNAQSDLGGDEVPF